MVTQPTAYFRHSLEKYYLYSPNMQVLHTR